jgi:hypothetical protein
MYQRRLVGLVLSIGAAGLILVSILSQTWWSAVSDNTSVHVGLRSAELCTKSYGDDTAVYRDVDDLYSDGAPPVRSRGGEACRDGSLRRLLRGDLDQSPRRAWDDDPDFYDPPRRKVSTAFVALGLLVFIAGLGSILGLVLAAATTKGGLRGRTTATLAAIGCGVFAGLALAFMVSAPAQLNELRAGVGLVLALAGAASGIAGALVLLRHDPEHEPTTVLLAGANHAAHTGRAPGLIAGVIGVALVLTSVFTDSWFRGTEGGVSLAVGVQEVEVCRRDDVDEPRFSSGPACVDQTIPARVEGARHPTRMKIFVAVGTLVMWTGIGAAIAFGLVALLVLLRQAVGGAFGLARAIYTTAGAFGLAALLYAVSWPKEIVGVHIWLGPFIAIAGAGCLVGAGVMIARWVDALIAAAPVAIASDASTPVPALAPSPFAPPNAVAALAPVPTPFAPPPVAPVIVIPPCPQCGTPMLWVSAKSIWLCTICRTRPAVASDD